MTTPLIIFLGGLAALFVCLMLSIFVCKAEEISSLWFLSVIVTGLGLITSILIPVNTKYYPVPCVVVSTQKTITVVTDYGNFTSNKKEDFDNWKDLTKGYIGVRYSTFGIETPAKTFLVKIPEPEPTTPVKK